MTTRRRPPAKTSKPTKPAGRKATTKARPKPKAPTPSPTAKARALNARQQAFTLEYLADMNATQAAIRAGYSRKTAASQGFDLLRKPEIQAAIQAELDARAARRLQTADAVLERIDRYAEAAASDGQYSAAIRGAELIGKHLGMFTDKLEHSGPGGGPIELTLAALTDEQLEDRIRQLEQG